MQLPPSIFHFVLDPHNDWRAYYIYAIYAVDGDMNSLPIYISYCEARDLMTGMSPRKNSAWLKLISERPTEKFIVSIIAKHPTVEAARNEAHRLSYRLRPIINMSGVERSLKRRVRCMNTMEEFNTASEAARWVQCSQPTMSAHLSQRPGFKTIKGFTFERID